MFDPDTAARLRSAPALPDLDPNELPQLLTQQYAELVARRLRGTTEETSTTTDSGWTLARIADAYEIVTSVHSDAAVRSASAFVAATAHQIRAREATAIEGDERPPILDRDQVDPSVAAALLFLAAEQYADAHEAAAAINPGASSQSYVATILAEHIRDLARGDLKGILTRAARWRRSATTRGLLETQAIVALYEALASGVELLAARMLAEPVPEAIVGRFDDARTAFLRVRDLSTHSTDAYHADLSGELLTTYPGPRHLASLLLAAHDGIAAAALTAVPPPDGADVNFWRAWLRHRAEAAPFMWPNHRIAIARGFYETGRSAVLVLPTGAGKTTVSGLKIASVLARGRKVVFLAPTHALVDQLTVDLQEMFPKEMIGAVVSSDFDLLFATGSQLQKIEVMTPERCLALLSFAPDAFADVGLLVFDECHLLSPKAGNLRRALDGMFCVLAFSNLAPKADFLFLSAMLCNGEQFSRWIERLTGRPCVFVDPLWKPSRQARGVVLYERPGLRQICRAAATVQATEDRAKGKTAKGLRASAKAELAIQPHALFGLQHNWLKDSSAICTIVKISDENVRLEGDPRRPNGVRLKPNVNKVAARLAVASARNGLKAIVFVNAKSHAVSTAKDISESLGKPPTASDEENVRWNALRSELGSLDHSVLAGPARAVPHNATMLALERDLAERMFRRPDGAQVIVATPTLAQGLNLPAHMAILAGDKRADPDDGGRESLEAHEILNAAARAGRAGHLANGVVLLIPEAILNFESGKPLSADVVGKLQSILPEDDRCVDVQDPLQVILDKIATSPVADLDVEYALNRLSTTVSPEGVASSAVTYFDVSRSFAAFVSAENNTAETFAARVASLNGALLARNSDNKDVALSELAAQSGAPISVLRNLRQRLADNAASLPTTIDGWVKWIVVWLAHDDDARTALLEREKRSILGAAGLPKDGHLTAQAIEKLYAGIVEWIAGKPLNSIERALGGNPSAERLCPRSRELVMSLVPRGLSFIVGLVARTTRDAVKDADPAKVPQAVIDCMATAVRRGFDTPQKLAFAELKTGVFSRVDMHIAFVREVKLIPAIGPGDDYGAVKAKISAYLASVSA